MHAPVTNGREIITKGSPEMMAAIEAVMPLEIRVKVRVVHYLQNMRGTHN